MATRVVYGDTADGAALSSDSATNYAAARAGTGSDGLLVDASATTLTVSGVLGIGQRFFGGNAYYVGQGFIAFDTTGITPSTATLSLNLSADTSTTDFVTRVYLFDWGTTLTTADFQANATAASNTLVAHIDSNGIGATGAYKSFTDDALAANINAAGFTRLLMVSLNQINNVAPTTDEHLSWSSADSTTPPKLTMTDTTTQGSQTLNGGATSFTPTITGTHDMDLWSGGSRVTAATGAKSVAGGGAYVFARYAVASLSAITVQVAATRTTDGSVGQDTWFNSSSAPDPLSKGAQGISASALNAGGLASSGRGSVLFDGGSGPAAQGGGGSRGGSGGGSSAGTAAAGANGTVGSGSAAGAKGTAPTGGGDGGIGGAGGGGAAAAGVVPGGGGGGGGSSSGSNGNGAAGKMIVYWYIAPATSPKYAPLRVHLRR